MPEVTGARPSEGDERQSAPLPLATLTLPLWTTYQGQRVEVGEITVDLDGAVQRTSSTTADVVLTPRPPVCSIEHFTTALASAMRDNQPNQ